MPAEYEKIRDNLIRSGKSVKAAKSEAAAIYNKRHKGNPVGRYSDAGRRKKKVGGRKRRRSSP